MFKYCSKLQINLLSKNHSNSIAVFSSKITFCLLFSTRIFVSYNSFFLKEVLDVYANFLTGQVPSQISQLSNLKELHLNDNNINGKIPDSICKLPLLTELVADCLGPDPEVTCSCATVCCRGLPDAKCFKLKKSPSTTTGKKTQQKKKKNTSTATKKKR